MEPENNIQNGVPEESKIEVEEITAVEERPAIDPVTDQNEKMSKTSLIGMIILTVIALAGVAFGIWGIKEKDNIEKSLAAGTMDTSVDCITEKELEEDENTTDIVDTKVGDTDDYIYIGEWGLKIKIPDGLYRVSYTFTQFGVEGQREGTNIGVYGSVNDKLSDFAYMGKNEAPLGAVSRIDKDTFSGPEYDGDPEDRRICGVDSRLVFSDGIYNYCYSHPQVVYSTNEEEKQIEIESTNLIEEMLSNPDNYSKI